MTIREAVPADAEQIIAHIQRIAEEPDRTILLGPGEFQLTAAQERRNKGVGTALLGRLVAWAESSAVIRRLDLEVWTHNAAARHLYRKFGFVEEGCRRAAYFVDGQFVDGILMARRLSF